MQLIPFLIATIIPLLFLFLIYKLDLFKTGYFRYILMSFFAGAIAFGIASLINRYLIDQVNIDRMVIIQYVAPIVEELLKCLILIYLVKRPSFTYYVEGATYGFAAGIGFAVLENYQYILSSSGSGIGVAIARVLSTNLMHASATSISGIFIGQSRFLKTIKGILFGSAGVLSALLIHLAYNNLVTRIDSGMLLLIAAGFGFISAGVIALSIRHGLTVERAWIIEKLGEEDRVTGAEARLVQGMDKLKRVLTPFTEKFGVKKAAQAEKFLVIQARLGILRKTLDLMADQQSKQAVEQQLVALQNEMDIVRRSVGAYAMLYVRHIFPSDASPIWQSIESAIQEKAQDPSGRSGINLWDTLAARQAANAQMKEKAKDQEENHDL
jgi:RsiW-degrading membrane proteinase PrsW (M82 family)